MEESDCFLVRKLDITDASARVALIQEIEEMWGGVDILINNAGISFRSVVEHMTDEDEQLQMATNFVAPIALIRLVLPGMRRKRAGRIINVSSVSGMMAMPTMGSYSASKYALEGATEALWYELRPWGIKVSLVQPGFIRSNSFRRVYHTEKGKKAVQENLNYAEYYQEMDAFVEKLMTRAHATPDHIARRVIKIMQKKNPGLRIPVTIDAHFFGFLRRVLPRRIYHHLLYRNLPGVKTWKPHENEHEAEP
jgi:short-subunit dehydrogenase